MAQKVLIIGDSGTGKSASLRNFTKDEILVINSAGKPLPFKNHFESVTPSYQTLSNDVRKAMANSNKKVIVIDDAQYIMSFQYMRRIKENGWDKWNDIQGDFFNIIKACDELPEDTIVYFLSHLQRDDEGHEKIKTMGKMLDEKITIEGLFTIVLKTGVKDGQYFFFTQNSGLDTVKSPIGMFPTYAIDNDLKYVDSKIRNYYEIGDYADDEEVEKMDQAVEKTEVVKPDASGRRSRRKQEPEATKEPETKGLGIADGQGAVSELTPTVETASPEPQKRRRKARAEEVEQTPSEEQKELKKAVYGDTKVDSQKVIDDALKEEPKRRRRKVKGNEITESEIKKFDGLDMNSDALPFY